MCVAAGWGCGGESPDATPDAPDFTSFKTLITSDWSLQPGTELYQCATATVVRDMYITELRPNIPLGTHHTVVSIGAKVSPDHPGYECGNPFEFGGRFIYGTGVGSKPFQYPTGVALKLTAGQQVHINLHLFNTGDEVLSGTSGVDVRESDGSTIQNLARMELSGPDTLTIPTGVSTQTHTCNALSEISVVSFQPHMHQLGTHLTYTVTPVTGEPYTLYDQDYMFEGQEHVMFDPIRTLYKGDQLKIDCTYNNTTGNIVRFGESSKEEMCFAAMTIYPFNTTFCQ
jgi:hypothetical protein